MMPDDVRTFVAETTERAAALEKALALAEWDAATTGTDEANQRQQQAQADQLRFWADPGRFARVKRLRQGAPPADPVLARQLQLIFLTSARNQQDERLIDRLTRLEAEVRAAYYNYRGQAGGKTLTDNEIESILLHSRSSSEARAAWEASKGVGAEVAPQIRQLAHLRNESARAQGYRDHFQRSLTMDEIDEHALMSLFTDLEPQTRAPFARLKAEIDRDRAQRFGVLPGDLRPWHFGDRFFQEAPPLGDFDMDAFFASKDPVTLARATYDGLGMPVDPILARSDLYARPGKNQHAFCTHIDRSGDIRTLNNLEPNVRWTNTLLHELGHSVYEAYLDPKLPWLLRTPSHILTTEAIAIMMGSLIFDEAWLKDIAGVPAADAARAAAAGRRRDVAAGLIFTRWCLVMTLFEKAMYADPEGDLDGLWWDLVERYQMVHRPDGRRAPDWAAKYHVALVPVYYQNYELGHLVAAQFADRLTRRFGGLVGRRSAGAWLIEQVFRPGTRQDWASHVQTATGEPLNPRYFVDSVS
jgi:peptidyl-dipeptidase A